MLQTDFKRQNIIFGITYLINMKYSCALFSCTIYNIGVYFF